MEIIIDAERTLGYSVYTIKNVGIIAEDKFTKLGRWWHRDKEIDLVALNEETKEIAFFEVKWSDLQLGEASRILAGLEEKSESVDWNNENRKEHFGVIGKRVEGKANLRGEGYLCYDLEDMQKKQNFH